MHGQTVPLCLNINSPLNEILVTRFEKKNVQIIHLYALFSGEQERLRPY